MTECFIKNNEVSRTYNICRKEHFSREIHLCSIYSFTVGEVTSALKKKPKKPTPTQNLPAYTNMFSSSLTTTSTWEPPLCTHTHQLDKSSRTHPLTQPLLPSRARTQTLRSHVKLLARNQSSRLWHSLTQTQTCFIPSPALENHVNHLYYLISQPKLAKYAPSQPQMPHSAFPATHASQIGHWFCYSLPNINLFSTPSLLFSLPCAP